MFFHLTSPRSEPGLPCSESWCFFPLSLRRFPPSFLVPSNSHNHVVYGLATLHCVCLCMHSALKWTRFPFRVYSHLTPRVPGIDHGFTKTLTKIKYLPKMTDDLAIKHLMLSKHFLVPMCPCATRNTHLERLFRFTVLKTPWVEFSLWHFA